MLRVALAASVLFASVAPAQLIMGSPAPSFGFDKVWNADFETFADLEGKVVILDFARTW